ncbi:MAG: hypothetical protein PHR35_19650 [Kiritimatiellae bacterium]|nr:hypothetical protein [Kiritimatiellia bacterium]
MIGLLLLPLCWAVTRAVLDLSPASLTATPPWVAPPLLAMVLGYICWVLIFTFLPSPVRAYIWAHELTHATWGFLTGARVGRISVSDTGGSVRLSHAGMFTTLAPYFVPFYTVIVILLRALLGLFVEIGRWELAWLFLVGLTWGFHLSFTLRSLMQKQPDIEAFGRLFSYVLIYLANAVGFGYWVVCITAATAPAFHHRLAERTRSSYHTSQYAVVYAVRSCYEAAVDYGKRHDRTKLLDETQ